MLPHETFNQTHFVGCEKLTNTEVLSLRMSHVGWVRQDVVEASAPEQHVAAAQIAEEAAESDIVSLCSREHN
jgi:hypothetical protein